MYWRLNQDITACIASGRVLFLDVRRDRYFALPPAANERFAAWLTRSGGGRLPEEHETLLARLKIIEQDTGHTATPCTITRARAVDAETLPPLRIGPGTALRVGSAVVKAAREVRHRPLAMMLDHRRQKRALRESSNSALTTRLAQFRAVRPLIPVPRTCLHDCLALLDWLGPSARDVQLVFGVSAFPFGAHCWLQAEGRVIDDHPESPSRYQPILHLP
jgi:hypothetical protein